MVVIDCWYFSSTTPSFDVVVAWMPMLLTCLFYLFVRAGSKCYYWYFFTFLYILFNFFFFYERLSLSLLSKHTKYRVCLHGHRYSVEGSFFAIHFLYPSVDGETRVIPSRAETEFFFIVRVFFFIDMFLAIFFFVC